MIKHDLREQGFSVEEKYQKKFIINMLWAVIALIMIIGTTTMLMFITGHVMWPDEESGEQPPPLTITSLEDKIPEQILETLGFLILYFVLKFVLTRIFCKDKNNSIKITILEDKAMPVCLCREAFKVWQTVIIYLVPFVVVYASMVVVAGVQIYVYMQYGFLFMLLFISFFLAFDLVLVIYVLLIRLTHKINYISIDHHIYDVTVYRKAYIKVRGKKSK